MSTRSSNGALVVLTGLLGLLTSAPGSGAPEGPASVVETRGSITEMEVLPPILPLMALAGAPAATGTINISELFGGFTDLNVNCSLGAVSGDPGVMISVPPLIGQTIAAGTTFMVTANCSGAVPGNAMATYTCVDPGAIIINDNTVIDCALNTMAQLAISGVTDPLRPGPGDPVDLVITVQNTGGSNNSPFTVQVLNLLGGVSFMPIADANWNCVALLCQYIGPPLTIGASVELRLPGTAPPGGVLFSADAQLTPSGGDTVMAPNPVTIVSGTASSLSLNVTPPPDPSPAGSMVVYSVTVNNQDRGIMEDGAPARNAAVSSLFVDTLMSGTENFVSGTGLNWNCSPFDFGDSTSVDCSYGVDIPVGMASTPLSITFIAPTNAPVSFDSSFTPTADNYTFLPADRVQVMTGINPTTDLSLAKLASVPSANVGDPITYTLDVTNNGPSDADTGSFTVTDTLPGEVTFVSAAGANFTCMEAGGIVTCGYIGPLAPSGSTFQITIDVTANAAGNALNNADVIANAPASDPNQGNNADTANVTIAGSTDLSIAKSASAPSANVGGPITYTLDVTNNGPSDAATGSFTVTDTLPSEVTFVSAAGVNFTCMEVGGIVTCDYVGPLAPSGSTFQIAIDVTANAVGNALNNADVITNAPAADPNPSNDNATASVAIGPVADLSIAKSASVATALVGQAFDFLLDVSNAGPSMATSFAVSDTLPSQVSFDVFSAADFACSEAARVVSCNYTGTGLATGQTSSITLGVTAVSAGTARNTATVSADAAVLDPDLNNNTASRAVTIATPGVDLVIDKSATESIEVGTDFSYLIRVSNLGGQDANDVRVADVLPAEVTFLGSLGEDWSCQDSDGTLDCSYTPGILGPGKTTVFRIGVVAAAAGDTVNTASVSQLETDTDPSNNSDSAAVLITLAGGADLSLAKSASVASALVDESFEYLLEVGNGGPLAATSFTVSDTLPPEVSFVGFSAADFDCSHAPPVVSCNYTGSGLAADQTSSITLSVTATAPGSADNSATVSADAAIPDPGLGNNNASASVSITSIQDADLALAKSSLPDTVTVDSAYQYRFDVSNAGPGAASGVAIDDTLPAGVQFVSAGGAGWTCSAVNAQVRCDLADFLASGASSMVTLTVTAPAAPGSILNVATVSAVENDADLSNNQASAATTVLEIGAPIADVSVLKQADRSSARQGDVISYAVTASNAGPDGAAGVQVTDALPQGLDLKEISATGWSCQATTSVIQCDLLQELGVGETATVNLTAQVLASSGSIVNQALISSITADPEPGNNSSTATTMVAGLGASADLELSIEDNVDPVLTGDPFDYLLTLRNNGPGTAGGIQVTGTLPVGVTVVNLLAPPTFTCQIDAQQLLCQTPDMLLVGIELPFTLSLLAPDEAGVISFSAEVAILNAGNDDNPDNNFASEDTEVRLTPTEDQLGEDLMDALGDSGDPLLTDNLMPVAALCDDPPPALIALCRGISDALGDGRAGEVAAAIPQLVGQQTITQQTALVEANTTQLRNVDARQAFNRGGGGGGQLTLNGLNFRYGNEHLPLSFLQVADDPEDPEISTDGLIKPWGFFINGTISGGEKDPTTREIGFDFDSYGLTAGVDYRFSTKMIGGAAIGYADFDSDGADGSELKTDGFTYHVFASYYPRDNFYIDGRLSYGKINLDQSRPISFTLGGMIVDEVAMGDTDSDQFSGAFAIGLLWNKGGWSFTPRASVSFMDAEIDGFTETGSNFALIYDKQDVKSLVFSAGLSASKVFSLSRGVLTPQFDFSFDHESRNDDNAFNSQIVGATSSSAFFVDSDEPDRNYANAGLGLVFIAANGKQAFLSYREVLGLGGFSNWTVNAGFRFEF